MGETDEWCSPPEIADALVEFFDGPVDVDPCSNARSIIKAVLAYTSGGLVLPWCLPAGLARDSRKTRSCYENFPYSQGDLWTAKALHEIKVGNVTELVRLSMASTSTHWWADMCNKPRRNPRILALRRMVFIDPTEQGRKFVSRFEPALTYIGPRTRQFDKTFAHLTRWSTWGRT